MFTRALRLDELWDGDMRACTVRDRRVLLVRVDGAVHAYEDRCAHLGVPLSAGRLMNHVLICSAHLYEYDARTGKGINPRNVCLNSFAVRIEDESIWVDV